MQTKIFVFVFGLIPAMILMNANHLWAAAIILVITALVMLVAEQRQLSVPRSD